MKKIIIALIAILVIFFIIFLFSRHNRDEKIIRKNLRLISHTVSKSKNDGDFALITKSQKIQLFFTKDCQIFIEYEDMDVNGINELIVVFQQAYRLVDEAKVNFYDISITMREDGSSAKTRMTAKATGLDNESGERTTGAREVEIVWKKIEGKWKISEIEAVETLH